MIRAAAIAAVAFASFSGGVQEPPARFSASEGDVVVRFRQPEEVRRLCGPSADPEHPVVQSCRIVGTHVLIMPNPWQCGSDARCAALWRHETAHALRDWKHEPI